MNRPTKLLLVAAASVGLSLTASPALAAPAERVSSSSCTPTTAGGEACNTESYTLKENPDKDQQVVNYQRQGSVTDSEGETVVDQSYQFHQATTGNQTNSISRDSTTVNGETCTTKSNYTVANDQLRNQRLDQKCR